MAPLGGAALVLSFVLLWQRRVRGCAAACALQGWAVALAAAWQGWTQAVPQLAVAAAVTLAVNGVLLPLALARAASRRGLPGAMEPALGALASLLLGFLAAALAVLAVRPARLGGIASAGESLAVALAIVLLGLAMMIARRGTLPQAAGLLSMANGLVLAMAGMPGMPMAGQLCVAALALGMLAVLGLGVHARQRRG